MKLLAHRGFWNSTDRPKNSWAALAAAFERGWGVETDIRDHCGVTVISHDAPTAPELTLEHVLQMDRPDEVPLAINVKADGLATDVRSSLSRHGVTGAFVFDMSVPDHLAWIAADVATLTRWSDIEPHPVLRAESSGVWLDAMRHDLWWAPDAVSEFLDAGKTVAVVSPELHRRAPLPVWQHIVDQNWHRSDHLMLCTDHPEDAEGFFR